LPVSAPPVSPLHHEIAIPPTNRFSSRKHGRKIAHFKKNRNGRFDMQSKAQIDRALRQKADTQEIPGLVAMAASGNEVVYQGAFGKRDLSKG
jgi:hypothetical protein